MSSSDRTPLHGSVEGLWQPPRGDYEVPMPLPHDSDQHAQVSPIPKHGGHVMVRVGDQWVPGLAATQDRAGERVWCTWVERGRVDWCRVEGWVDWEDVRAVVAGGSKPPF